MIHRKSGIRFRTRRLLVAAWFAAVLPVPPAQSELAVALWQEGSQASGQIPRVSVGEINGTPGGSVMVPLYFTPDPKMPLRSVTVNIDYVSNNLKFERVSRGVAAETIGADVVATLTEGTADEKGMTRSKLRFTASVVDANARGGLPEGLLAYLLFQISLDAKPFAIKLNPTIASAEDLQNKKMANVKVQPGLVVVEVLNVLPEVACFFFTH